jgi:hypothetical protein
LHFPLLAPSQAFPAVAVQAVRIPQIDATLRGANQFSILQPGFELKFVLKPLRSGIRFLLQIYEQEWQEQEWQEQGWGFGLATRGPEDAGRQIDSE